MKNKLNFLDGLSNLNKQSKYQEFIVEMGISKHVVLIPFSKSTLFETTINQEQPSTIKSLREIVAKFDGTVEE